jgi:alpha-L-rhamnosidase
LFLQKAKELVPNLIREKRYPTEAIEIIAEKDCFQGWGKKHSATFQETLSADYGNRDCFVLDFGEHMVGYLNLSIRPFSIVQDSPLRLKCTFGETLTEIIADENDYHGWLSSTWLQHEIINVDLLPLTFELPRRYAFRYLAIEILGCNTGYRVKFDEVFCMKVTTGDTSKITPLPNDIDETIKQLDQVSINTLKDCMQLVFEDGPKRDRRLWIGDLRLQALANYETFDNIDLVRRCIYYFAGLTQSNGQISCCVYTEPVPHTDRGNFNDYSLFFVSILYDYYIHTKDKSFIIELWEIALTQMKLAFAYFDEKGMIFNQECFVDWCEGLDKQASSHGIVIYVCKQGVKLAEMLGDNGAVCILNKKINLYENMAKKHLFDQNLGLFVSGKDRQISWASQVWLVLADVFNCEENGKILDKLIEMSPDIIMHTPYMWHHFIQALINSNRKSEAMVWMQKYWGYMVEKGADCFFEAFNPNDDFESPYGDHVINSYCHAWSCTPTYFIRKYFLSNTNDR